MKFFSVKSYCLNYHLDCCLRIVSINRCIVEVTKQRCLKIDFDVSSSIQLAIFYYMVSVCEVILIFHEFLHFYFLHCAKTYMVSAKLCAAM